MLRTSKTHDPYLAVCARNIWYVMSLLDIDAQYAHFGVNKIYKLCSL